VRPQFARTAVRSLRVVPRRAASFRRACSTVAAEAEAEAAGGGNFSFSNPNAQLLAATLGIGYLGAFRWAHKDKTTAAAIAEMKAEHEAANPAPAEVRCRPLRSRAQWMARSAHTARSAPTAHSAHAQLATAAGRRRGGHGRRADDHALGLGPHGQVVCSGRRASEAGERQR